MCELAEFQEIADWPDRAAAWAAVKDCPDVPVYQKHSDDPKMLLFRVLLNHNGELCQYSTAVRRDILASDPPGPCGMRECVRLRMERTVQRFLRMEKRKA